MKVRDFTVVFDSSSACGPACQQELTLGSAADVEALMRLVERSDTGVSTLRVEVVDEASGLKRYLMHASSALVRANCPRGEAASAAAEKVESADNSRVTKDEAHQLYILTARRVNVSAGGEYCSPRCAYLDDGDGDYCTCDLFRKNLDLSDDDFEKPVRCPDCVNIFPKVGNDE